MQWKGLTLEEPPSWSWLTSTPGKYALFEFELSSCPNHQCFSRWETLLYVFNPDFEYELGCRCKQIVLHIAKNGEIFCLAKLNEGKHLTAAALCDQWNTTLSVTPQLFQLYFLGVYWTIWQVAGLWLALADLESSPTAGQRGWEISVKRLLQHQPRLWKWESSRTPLPQLKSLSLPRSGD